MKIHDVVGWSRKGTTLRGGAVGEIVFDGFGHGPGHLFLILGGGEQLPCASVAQVTDLDKRSRHVIAVQDSKLSSKAPFTVFVQQLGQFVEQAAGQAFIAVVVPVGLDAANGFVARGVGMDADKEIRAELIAQFAPGGQSDCLVDSTGHDHGGTHDFELLAKLESDGQGDFLFLDAVRNGTGIGAAVAGVDKYGLAFKGEMYGLG